MNAALLEGLLIGLVLGAIAGGLVSRWLMWDGFTLAARYTRTGRLEAPVQLEPGSKLTSPSPEASANRRISEDAVNHGAEQLMSAALEQGVPMDRRRAREQARELLQQADPLGGAR